MKHNERIAFRLPKEYREKIEQLIREGKFQKISQIIREALKQFLEINAERLTEIEIELPISEEAKRTAIELSALAENLEKNHYSIPIARYIKNYLKAQKELRTIRIKGKNIDSETMDYIKEKVTDLIMK